MSDFYREPVGLLTGVKVINLRAKLIVIKTLEITFIDNSTNEERVAYIPLPTNVRFYTKEIIDVKTYLETNVIYKGKRASRSRHFYCVHSAVKAIQSLIEIGVPSSIRQTRLNPKFFTYYETKEKVLEAYENRDRGFIVTDVNVIKLSNTVRTNTVVVMKVVSDKEHPTCLKDGVNEVYLPIPNKVEVGYDDGKFYIRPAPQLNLVNYSDFLTTRSYSRFRKHLEDILEELDVDVRHTDRVRSKEFFTIKEDVDWLPKQYKELLINVP